MDIGHYSSQNNRTDGDSYDRMDNIFSENLIDSESLLLTRFEVRYGALIKPVKHSTTTLFN